MKRSPLRRKRIEPRREENPWIFPTEDDIKKEPVAVRVFKDGREACNLLTKAGQDEYQRRKRVAWEAQTFRSIGIEADGQYCAICKARLYWQDVTADHKKPRKMGGGSRDDRQENLAAVHWVCNAQRGSKRSGYYDVP